MLATGVSLPVFAFLGIAAAVVLAILLLSKLIKGIVWLIGRITWFVGSEIGDSLRLVGSVLTTVMYIPMLLGNIILGRWSATGHIAKAMGTEIGAVGGCCYRLALGNPARLLGLRPMTEGMEQRLPKAVAQMPGRDKPSKKTGDFEGYDIVGSLPAGGSGAKLFIANPDPAKRDAYRRLGRSEVGQVVIKSFSMADGSTLPQIVRERQALEAARNLGLVLEHGINEKRFYYVMPYVPGEDLGAVTSRLHARAGESGLTNTQLREGLTYVCDLLDSLDRYHRGGLWHKDIKPENVIVSQGRAHLVDLGLVTPLHSAMTLTTHGTEYFRDPELVRQAMRGVKVKDVDGVRFDLYGVGAVLYSLMENSFPAHGSLSKVTKRCPEALNWVIRRAMADLQNRYRSAAEMAGDLRTVMLSPDPFGLKPANLPSMNGAPIPAAAAPPIAPAADSGVEPPPLSPYPPARPASLRTPSGRPVPPPPRFIPPPPAVAAVAPPPPPKKKLRRKKIRKSASAAVAAPSSGARPFASIFFAIMIAFGILAVLFGVFIVRDNYSGHRYHNHSVAVTRSEQRAFGEPVQYTGISTTYGNHSTAVEVVAPTEDGLVKNLFGQVAVWMNGGEASSRNYPPKSNTASHAPLVVRGDGRNYSEQPRGDRKIAVSQEVTEEMRLRLLLLKHHTLGSGLNSDLETTYQTIEELGHEIVGFDDPRESFVELASEAAYVVGTSDFQDVETRKRLQDFVTEQENIDGVFWVAAEQEKKGQAQAALCIVVDPEKQEAAFKLRHLLAR